MSIETKVVVYGSTADTASGAQLFLDAVANVDDDGAAVTEYYPGDSVYYLAIIPDGYRFVAIKATGVDVASLGSVSREQTDRILFTEKGVGESLSQEPSGGVTPTWYGPTAVVTVTDQEVSASAAPVIADLSYNYAALQYKITCPASVYIGDEDGDDYPIGLVLYVEATA